MQRSMLAGNRVADAGKRAQALGTGRAGTQITVYTDQMHDDVSWGNYIKGYVATAIKEDEFVVYFQPKFDIETEKVKGAEALIRWNYKKREFLPPSKFIPSEMPSFIIRLLSSEREMPILPPPLSAAIR